MASGLLRMLCFWAYRNSDGFAELHGMRNVMLWAAACAAATTALGQLPNGSVAPDWTATDLDGNTHHLYSLLDSGYVVIIDFSATWCGPCWNYHNSGALEQVYETYGPDGTNEVRVFFAEGDPATSLDALHGIGGGTAGDWVTGTPYPILHTDGPAMYDAYACSYYPTIYTICPNRLLTQSGQISAAAHGTLATSPTCAPASGVEEAAAPAWSIVPNPTSGAAVAQLPRDWEAAEVAVLDAASRQVAQPRPVNGRVELQAADLAPGIYVVRATQGGKVSTVRWSVL